MNLFDINSLCYYSHLKAMPNTTINIHSISIALIF